MKRKKRVLKKPDRVEKKKNPNAVEYVNNDFFLSEMISYNRAVKLAEDSGEEKPRIPDTIGECITKIAYNFSRKYNFVNIPFRHEMISDAILMCVKAVENRNFDPEVSKNPFAYFSQVVYFAFLRRINEEEKHQYIKYKSIQSHFGDQEEELSRENVHIQNVMPEDVHDFMSNFERKKAEKAKKTKQALKLIDKKSMKLFSLLFC